MVLDCVRAALFQTVFHAIRQNNVRQIMTFLGKFFGPVLTCNTVVNNVTTLVLNDF